SRPLICPEGLRPTCPATCGPATLPPGDALPLSRRLAGLSSLRHAPRRVPTGRMLVRAQGRLPCLAPGCAPVPAPSLAPSPPRRRTRLRTPQLASRQGPARRVLGRVKRRLPSLLP